MPALTAICVAAPAMVVMLEVVPVRVLASVPVTVCTVPATVPVVNVTVAIPLELVVLVAVPNEPPLVLDQVTTLPDVETALLFASAN